MSFFGRRRTVARRVLRLVIFFFSVTLIPYFALYGIFDDPLSEKGTKAEVARSKTKKVSKRRRAIRRGGFVQEWFR